MRVLFSSLEKEWHPSKNGNLKPSDVKSKSNKKIWWLCEKGHEWKAVVANRTVHGRGCPFCSGQRVIKGENDLMTLKPKVANEWHPIKNGDLEANEVKVQSHKKVWWQCKEKHEWEAVVYSRVDKGCPFCAGLRPIMGKTDLLTINPELASQWHPTMNGEVNPKDVTANSHKIVWWQCKKGHEWKRSVHGRTSTRSGCPYCSGRYAIKGETDLLTRNPELVKEWHPTKNIKLKPEDVTNLSHRKVWWQCEKKHEWVAAIYSRNRNACPYCSGKKAIRGETDLVTINPELAKEWHPSKNGNLNPDDVTSRTNKKVWWKCEKGHEWRAMVNMRACGTGCPECNRSR